MQEHSLLPKKLYNTLNFLSGTKNVFVGCLLLANSVTGVQPTFMSP